MCLRGGGLAVSEEGGDYYEVLGGMLECEGDRRVFWAYFLGFRVLSSPMSQTLSDIAANVCQQVS